MKMFVAGLALAVIAFFAWNSIPGFRYAAPHHLVSAADRWAVPVNPRIATLPCQDDAHPNESWIAHSDGLCHADDRPGAKPLPQQRSMPVTNGALTVAAHSYSFYPFKVPDGVSTVGVSGKFTASGGSGNDIIAYILDDDGFVNFKNGHEARMYYNSGKVTQASIGISLPNTATTYYLIFDNQYSIITPKAVTSNVAVNYMQ